MITTLLLAAMLTLPQERVVAVIIHPDRPVVIMAVKEAERQLRTTRDPILRGALVRALGSIGDGHPEPKLSRQERERFRWHRRPTQKPKGN